MATNPLINQGVLNRLRGSVLFAAFPQLNVTAPFLGKAGIRLALVGQSTVPIPTMTGTVQSPEPYMMVNVTIALLKTQRLADLYKKQMEDTSILGDCTVRPDAATLSPYNLLNTAIETVPDQSYAGDDAGYAVTLNGYYLVNNSLWNL